MLQLKESFKTIVKTVEFFRSSLTVADGSMEERLHTTTLAVLERSRASRDFQRNERVDANALKKNKRVAHMHLTYQAKKFGVLGG